MGDAAVNRLIGVLGRRFRRRRMTMFIDTLKPNRETRILDVGGTVAFWAASGVTSPIVVLNPALWAAGDGPENVSFTEGDGTATGYHDHEFDMRSLLDWTTSTDMLREQTSLLVARNARAEYHQTTAESPV